MGNDKNSYTIVARISEAKKQDVRLWTGFNWLWMFEHGNEPLGSQGSGEFLTISLALCFSKADSASWSWVYFVLPYRKSLKMPF
jgi:hypothetical protein